MGRRMGTGVRMKLFLNADSVVIALAEKDPGIVLPLGGRVVDAQVTHHDVARVSSPTTLPHYDDATGTVVAGATRQRSAVELSRERIRQGIVNWSTLTATERQNLLLDVMRVVSG